MRPQDMEQRQIQIKKLHKKIREYKLDPAEFKLLEKNKIELQINIEAKFFNCKCNQQYKFPLEQSFSDSPSISPCREKQIYNLFSQNNNLNLKATPWQNYKVPDKKIVSSLSFDNNHNSHKIIKNRQNLSNCKMYSDHDESTIKNSIEKKTGNLKTRVFTQVKIKQQQLQLSEDEPTAFKIPEFHNVANLKKCLKKTENDYSQKKLLTKKIITINQKQNISGGKKLNVLRKQGIKNTAKNNFNSNSSLKKIYLTKPAQQKNKSMSKGKSGLFIIDKSPLNNRNKLFTQTCKSNQTQEFFKNTRYETTKKSNQNYRIFIDNISTESKIKSQSKNKKKDGNKGLQVLKKIENISFTNKNKLNQNSLTKFQTHNNGTIKQNINTKSNYRFPINLCSPINKRIVTFTNR